MNANEIGKRFLKLITPIDQKDAVFEDLASVIGSVFIIIIAIWVIVWIGALLVDVKQKEIREAADFFETQVQDGWTVMLNGNIVNKDDVPPSSEWRSVNFNKARSIAKIVTKKNKKEGK